MGSRALWQITTVRWTLILGVSLSVIGYFCAILSVGLPDVFGFVAKVLLFPTLVLRPWLLFGDTRFSVFYGWNIRSAALFIIAQLAYYYVLVSFVVFCVSRRTR